MLDAAEASDALPKLLPQAEPSTASWAMMEPGNDGAVFAFLPPPCQEYSYPLRHPSYGGAVGPLGDAFFSSHNLSLDKQKALQLLSE